MKKDERIQKLLNRIAKKGDIHDAISKKKNVIEERTITKIIKTHIILFSRILYFGIIGSSKLKNKFTSVKRAKKAQDEIREYLGVPIDILRTKNRKKELVVSFLNYYYELYNLHYLNREYLIDSLKKIDDFCKTYNISRVYLDRCFIYDYFNNEYIGAFPYKMQSDIVNTEEYRFASNILLDLDIKSLEEIIGGIEKCEYNPQFISQIRKKLTDDVVKKAIDDFKRGNDPHKLLNAVTNRLLFHLNSDVTVKDRTYGKIYEQIDLGGTFIRSSKYDKNGTPISKDVMTLYDYLDVNNYQDLSSCLDVFSDDQEIKLISLLYLHILGESKLDEINKEEIVSFYDFIYDRYQKKPIMRKIPWVKNKLQKIKSELIQYLMTIGTILLTIASIPLSVVIPRSLNVDEEYLERYIALLDDIADLYETSARLEEMLVNKLKRAIKKILPEEEEEFVINRNRRTSEECVAEIEWFSDSQMPVYFMDSYASRGNYHENDISYWYNSEKVNLDKIEDVRPMFQVKSPLSDYALDAVNERDVLTLPLELCPVGDDYVINQIYIVDDTDPSKLFHVDTKWYEESNGYLTNEEKELLESMETPMISYIYGLSNTDNSMLSFDPPKYTQSDKDEVKSAILRGLGLPDGATETDINEAIKKKEYTSSPDIDTYKTLDEVEYFEQIASLDKIDPDILIALTINANSDLIYTIGYRNANNDDKITTRENYIWIMDENGDIIDILANFSKNEDPELVVFTEGSDDWLNYQEETVSSPLISPEERKEQQENIKWTFEDNKENKKEGKRNDNEETNLLKSIFSWAKDNHMSYYLAAILACLIIYKIFGKKIKINMQIKHTHNILNDEDMAKTYAELLHLIYGEESDPIKRSEEEIIDLITKELAFLKEENIKSLLKNIKATFNSNDNKTTQKVEELLKYIPFIIKEHEQLKKTKEKKLVLGGKNEN